MAWPGSWLGVIILFKRFDTDSMYYVCRVKKRYSYHITMSSSDLPPSPVSSRTCTCTRTPQCCHKRPRRQKHGAGAPPPPPHPPPFHPDFLKRPILIGKGKKYNKSSRGGAARTGDWGGGSAIAIKNCKTKSTRKSLRLVQSGIRVIRHTMRVVFSIRRKIFCHGGWRLAFLASFLPACRPLEIPFPQVSQHNTGCPLEEHFFTLRPSMARYFMHDPIAQPTL